MLHGQMKFQHDDETIIGIVGLKDKFLIITVNTSQSYDSYICNHLGEIEPHNIEELVDNFNEIGLEIYKNKKYIKLDGDYFYGNFFLIDDDGNIKNSKVKKKHSFMSYRVMSNKHKYRMNDKIAFIKSNKIKLDFIPRKLIETLKKSKNNVHFMDLLTYNVTEFNVNFEPDHIAFNDEESLLIVADEYGEFVIIDL